MKTNMTKLFCFGMNKDPVANTVTTTLHEV